MKYEIKGGNLPVVLCTLQPGETMVTESGAMSWMSPNMKMARRAVSAALSGACSPANPSSRTATRRRRTRG